LKANFNKGNENYDSQIKITRRQLFKHLSLISGVGTVFIGISGATNANSNITNILPQSSEIQIDSINITQIAIENKINITVKNTTANTKVSIDRKTFTQVEVKETPNLFEWIFFQSNPPTVKVKRIPNSELLLASIVAGSATSIIRDGLLYPLSTIKNRIQAQKISREKANMEISFQNIFDEFWMQVQQPNLFAGVVPSLLVTVPSAGAYFGVRDVSARLLQQTIQTPSRFDDLAVSVIGALIADVIALVVRTPVDVLALRKQIATSAILASTPPSVSLTVISNMTNSNLTTVMDSAENSTEIFTSEVCNTLNTSTHKRQIETIEEVEALNVEMERKVVGTWWQDSLERLPAVLFSDLPYLLSRISLNKLLVSGNENLAEYALSYTAIACVCAALTTPFDVARTRILIDSDNDPTNGIDGGSRGTILQTMINVTKEGRKSDDGEVIEGNFWNLYTGWLERTIYLGLGVSWLDPIRVIGYLGLRDAILLEWPFDSS